MSTFGRPGSARLRLAVAAFLAAAASCSPISADDPLSEMSVARSAGDGAIVVIRGEERIAVSERLDLREGDKIETRRDAEARLRLQGERTALVADASLVEVVSSRALAHTAGSLLVEPGDRTEVELGNSAVFASGALVRIDRGAGATRVAAYEGSLTLAVPGRPWLEVPELFQASLTAGAVAAPQPYRLDPADSWDAERLADVVALDEDLNRLAAGFANQVGSRRPGLGYFRTLAGGPVVFMRPYIRRPAADLFIGFAIADRAEGAPGRAFERAFELRDADGSWGVVATIMGVAGDPLVARIERLFLDTGVFADDGDSSDFRTASEPAEPGATTGGSATAASGSGGGGTGATGPAGGSTGGTGGSGGTGGGSGDGSGGGGGSECEGLECTLDTIPSLPLPTPTIP